MLPKKLPNSSANCSASLTVPELTNRRQPCSIRWRLHILAGATNINSVIRLVERADTHTPIQVTLMRSNKALTIRYLLWDDLIRECGRLPLALSMVGAMLRGRPSTMWDRVYDLLRHADLDKISARFPDYPYPSLLAAIQVSIDDLDATTRERYLALAVLLEDMPASPAIQQCLWKVDEYEAAETAGRLVSLSLAQRDGADGGVRLHDLQLD